MQTTIPDAGLDSDGLRLFFFRLGFSEEEMVALMGSHTIGRFTSLLDVCVSVCVCSAVRPAPSASDGLGIRYWVAPRVERLCRRHSSGPSALRRVRPCWLAGCLP